MRCPLNRIMGTWPRSNLNRTNEWYAIITRQEIRKVYWMISFLGCTEIKLLQCEVAGILYYRNASSMMSRVVHYYVIGFLYLDCLTPSYVPSVNSKLYYTWMKVDLRVLHTSVVRPHRASCNCLASLRNGGSNNLIIILFWLGCPLSGVCNVLYCWCTSIEVILWSELAFVVCLDWGSKW